MRAQILLPLGAIIASTAIFGCGSTPSSTGPAAGGNTTGTGGAAGTSSNTGGAVASGGGAQGGATSSAQGGSAYPTGGVSSAQGGSGGSNVGGGGGNTGRANTGGLSSTGGSGGGNSGGTFTTGGANIGGAHTGGLSSTGGSGGGNSGGTSTTGGAHTGGNSSTGGSGGGNSGGTSTSGGANTGGNSGGTGGSTSVGGGSGCSNTDTGVLNEDSSGYVCNNTWGIKGAWYCYSDGSDSSTSCKGSDGKGDGAVPWDASSSAMCLSGTMGTGSGSYAGIGFKLNSGPPGDTATPGTWNASGIVGFAITLTPGASGKGSGGMVLNLEYPTSGDLDPQTKDAPGITVPGVGSSAITYNALFSDAVLANNPNNRFSVDPSQLTDVKIAFFPDSISHTYDFCIKSVVPLTAAPNPVAATGTYGPTWNNQQPQAVNGINGYAVQSAPFPSNGNPMTMQVNVTSGGVGFTYTPGSGYNAPNNGPGSFPAVISGWGPGHDGIQFYGPYKTAKQIGQLTSVKSSWTFTMGSSGDAVYDVWFGNSATPAVPQVELMVWIGNTGKNPLGSVANPGTAVSGRTPYVGTNGTGEQVVSYWVASPGTTSVSNFDLLPYFQDAASHGYGGLSNNSYLLGVQTGFEVYSGNWSTTDYNISIQ
jgi:hypothetical protein